MDFARLTIEEIMSNETSVIESLRNAENWNEIPMLNYAQLQDLPDHSFVRFRGMIQDMLDPEIYLQQYQIHCITDDGVEASGNEQRCGKYRDTFGLKDNEEIDYDSRTTKHGERMSLFMVTCPALNDWAVTIEKEMVCLKMKTNESNDQRTEESQAKRSLETDDIENDSADSLHSNKKINSMRKGQQLPADTGCLLSAEYLLNSPIPERPSRACIVKVYEDFDRYTLNSMIDVVGILSVDPILDGTQRDTNDFDEITEIQAANPPPSLIPRLHAVCIRPIGNLNPLLYGHCPNSNDTIDGMSTNDIYKDCHLILTQCLFGDHIAATYLMAHLISSVYVRSELETLGQFCLNLTNFPAEMVPDYTTMLYSVLEMLLPASHYFPMTLDNMNTKQFSPKKDYTTNKLTSGMLQLAPHTHLVLDETCMQPGKLEANGIMAVSSIAHLINHQKIKCDYKFYQIDFNVDVPVLILSEGKSMLPSTFYLPIQPDTDCIPFIIETIDAVKHFLKSREKCIRNYLAQLKVTAFNMNPDDVEMIQNDFVEMRRRQHKVTPDVLHSLLVLSRLLGLCQGKSMLHTDLWTQAKELEAERTRRIELMPRRK